MDTSNNTHDKIELRSEKVRKLIGELPKSLIRWSSTIILIIIVIMLTALFVLPYPYSNGERIISHILKLLI